MISKVCFAENMISKALLLGVDQGVNCGDRARGRAAVEMRFPMALVWGTKDDDLLPQFWSCDFHLL